MNGPRVEVHQRNLDLLNLNVKINVTLKKNKYDDNDYVNYHCCNCLPIMLVTIVFIIIFWVIITAGGDISLKIMQGNTIVNNSNSKRNNKYKINTVLPTIIIRLVITIK